jgi:hypothetical protein
MAKVFFVSLFTILSLSSFAGNGSGAGGAPVVFQSELLQHILADRNFIQGFDMLSRAYITSIERLHAAKGVSTYRFTSNGGCDIKIVADCSSAMKASECTVNYGPWECP